MYECLVFLTSVNMLIYFPDVGDPKTDSASTHLYSTDEGQHHKEPQPRHHTRYKLIVLAFDM